MLKSHINLSIIILWIWRYPSCSDTSISFLSLDRSQGSATWSTSWTAGSSSSKARSSSSCSRTQCRKRRLGTGKWAMLPDSAWIWLVVVRFSGVISNNLQKISSSDGYDRGHRAADSPQDLVRSEARFAALEPSVLQLREELEEMRKMRLGNETEECGHFILDIYGISMVYLWYIYTISMVYIYNYIYIYIDSR